MASTILPSKFYIYKITSKTMGMSYVGLTRHKVTRVGQHFNRSCNPKLDAAIELYGVDDFLYEILAEVGTLAEARKAELAAIKALNSFWPNGFNIMGGGRGSISRASTPEAKTRRSQAMRKKWTNPEFRKKMLEASLNKPPPSAETRAKLSRIHKEKWNALSEEEKTKVCEKLTEAWNSGEDGARRRDALRQRWSDPGFKKRHTAAMIASAAINARTPESRQKQSETMRKRWADPEFRKAKSNRDLTAFKEATKKRSSDPEMHEKRSASVRLGWLHRKSSARPPKGDT